jgi:hypothetical protein
VACKLSKNFSLINEKNIFCLVLKTVEGYELIPDSYFNFEYA